MIDEFLAAVTFVIGRIARIIGWLLVAPLPWWFYAAVAIGLMAAFDTQM